MFYDDALRLIGTRPAVDLAADFDQIFCVGFPTTVPGSDLADRLSRAWGVPVAPWPHRLSEARYNDAMLRATRVSHEMEATDLPPQPGLPVTRAGANFRTYDRIRPAMLLEILLGEALEECGDRASLVLPWASERFDSLERPGMFGLDAPGHQFAPALHRIRRRHDVPVVELWPGQGRAERWKIPLQRALMSAARNGLLLARALRDRIRPFPAGPVGQDGGSKDLPALGFIVQGASQWNSLRPLVRACAGRYRPVLLAHDIFRSPTAYRTLLASGEPFVPIDSLVGPGGTVASLARSAGWRWRALRPLRARSRAAEDVEEQERLGFLALDGELIPELALYREQVRSAIRKYGLSAVVSANIVDHFITGTTSACHEEGVPHVCIQNAAMHRIHLPVYCDSDLYLAESREQAEFLRSAGALGRVEAVGLPYFDELLATTREAGEVVMERFPEIRGKRVVVVTTQTELFDFRPLLEPLVSLAAERDDLAVIIKLHPRENPGAYADLGERLLRTGRGGRLQHEPLTAVLAAADFLVSVVSTTIQSAIIVGVRPFSWLMENVRTFADRVDYMRPEVTTSAGEPNEVIATLLRALDVPGEQSSWAERREEFLRRYVTGADGKSSERVLDLLDELLPGPRATVEPDALLPHDRRYAARSLPAQGSGS